MKKIISIVMITLIFAMVIPSPIGFAAATVAYESYDFTSEIGTTGNAALGAEKPFWNKTTNVSSFTADSTVFTDGGVKITATGAGRFQRYFSSNSLSEGTYVMTLDVHVPDTAGRWIMVQGSDGYTDVLALETVGTYHINLTVNTVNGGYTIVYNKTGYNEQTVTGTLESGSYPIQRMGLRLGEACVTYIDNLTIYNKDLETVGYLEDFETEGTYDLTTNGSTGYITDEDNTYAVIAGEGANDARIQKTFDCPLYSAVNPTVLFSADVKVTDKNADRLVVMQALANGANKASAFTILQFEKNSTRILFNGSASGVTYDINKWYSIKLLYNAEDAMIDFYLNGVYINSGSLSSAGIDNVVAFWIRHRGVADTTSTTYIDNLAAETPSQTSLVGTCPVDFAQNFEYGDGITLTFDNLIDYTEMNVTINDSASYVSSVLPSESNDSELVISTQNLSPLTLYTLKATNIKDIFGNDIDDVTLNFRTASQFTVGTPVYYADGNVTTSIATTESFKTNLRVDINDGGTHDVCVISAVYDKSSNTLEDVYYDAKEDIVGGADFECIVSVPANAQNYKIVTYIWDSITGLKPIDGTIELNAN